MAQLVVRNLETTVKRRLQNRAARHGRSMEEEVREILRTAAREEEPPPTGLGSEISALFSKTGLRRPIPELRGLTIKPPRFDE